jgi:hypothetical protein
MIPIHGHHWSTCTKYFLKIDATLCGLLHHGNLEDYLAIQALSSDSILSLFELLPMQLKPVYQDQLNKPPGLMEGRGTEQWSYDIATTKGQPKTTPSSSA